MRSAKLTLSTTLGAPLALALCLAMPAGGQESAAAPASTSAPGLSAVAWLAGTWEGALGDDPVTEAWFPPADGTMVALFRWEKGGTVFLYELMRLAETPAGLTLEVKHFGADFTGWEEKDDAILFDLVEVTPEGQAVFAERGDEVEHTRVTYRPDGEAGMIATFEETRNGQPVLLTFRYRRR
ncbi:MAG TPA: DUF6265 family protein [Thermoanaerobaculia bacterium]|nr:DUF6265 family protein [Thermoanaerobaculia bacterium]